MDLYSVAVPLINGQGEVVAAINVSMEASYKVSADIEKIIWKLTKTGQMVSSILGYQGPYPSFST